LPGRERSAFEQMDRHDLLRALEMFAKNWLAHDGCWFLAAEERYGMENAIDLDARSWKRFAALEARRIMNTFGIPEGGGLQALEKALRLRPYAFINTQCIHWSDDRRHLRFFMDVCRVQETRRRKGLPDFPCKTVGPLSSQPLQPPSIHAFAPHPYNALPTQIVANIVVGSSQ